MLLLDRPELKEAIKSYEPMKSAASLAALLTEPTCHANTLRIELLIHALLSVGKGRRIPDTPCLLKWLNGNADKTRTIGLEDPVEDVFVSNTVYQGENYRTFEGTWECNDFYLQRVLNAIETLPDSEDSRTLRLEIAAALKLSEQIARRRNLTGFSPGSGLDKGKLPLPSTKRLNSLKSAVEFSREDLDRIGVAPADIAPFVLAREKWQGLVDGSIADSDLVRHPIVRAGRKWCVMLANAISPAVRHHILTWLASQGLEESFDRHLLIECLSIFENTPFFEATFPPNVVPQRIGNYVYTQLTREFDEGRYLHIVPVVDSISEYVRHGMIEPSANSTELCERLEKCIEETRNHFATEVGFKKGMSLVVMCGFGRPWMTVLPSHHKNWNSVSISAPDFETLAWAIKAEPLRLWKLLEMRELLRTHGVDFINPNGILNFYSYWRDTSYFLVPRQLEFGRQRIHITIPTDSMTSLRHQIREAWDVHSLPLHSGLHTMVRRSHVDSYFPDEDEKRIYVSIDALHGGELLGVVKGKNQLWWLKAKCGECCLA
jgi:hypothetical protein